MKELVLVLASFRTIGFRFKTLAVVVVLAGCGLGHAQTAPTLLPYTAKLIAGGGTASKVTFPGLCPSSGLMASDTYGDGCLATELALTGPRYAVADAAGNVFFSDYGNNLIRRIDAVTGVVNLVAGSVYTSPVAGASCGTGYTTTSTDAKGDGCLGVQVNVYEPVGLVFSPAGDLYFSEAGNSDVRKIAATAGLIPASTVGGVTVYTGVITLVDGSPALKTSGYASDNATTTINAATQSFLDTPYGLSFDSSGHLFVTEEYRNAVLVVNTNTTGTDTVNGISIPAGTVAKIMGATSTGSTCPNGSVSADKCAYGTYTPGSAANTQETDSPYAVAAGPSGNTYVANTYTRTVGAISASGTLTNFAGTLNTKGTTLMRGSAGSFAIGTVYSVASDTSADVYLTDPVNGVVWRVDGAGNHPMYVVAGGATSVCNGATDKYGDGCPATQATLGSTPGASTPVNATGVFGVSVDSHSDLFLGDTSTNLIREIASGTQFGQVGSAVTQTLEIHFGAGDTPAANAYTLTQTTPNFTLGSATCTSNSDATTDCLLPVTAVVATSANLGAFSAVLAVNSTMGGTNTFTLTGTHVQTPVTRTTVGVSPVSSCTNTTTFAAGTAVTLTASIISTGTPGGTVQFYANNAPISTPIAVSGGTAQLNYTFTMTGTYTISATYSGDSYFASSTGTSGTTITLTTPSLSSTTVETPINNSIVQGQTATYSFNLAQSVYSGTVTFSVSGLPANSTATFSPSSISATGCTTSSVVGLTIQTSLAQVKQSGFAGGSGPWRMGVMFVSLFLAGVLAVRRRSLRGNWPRLTMVLALLVASSSLIACGKAAQTGVSTPTGSYPLVVKATGSDGTSTTVGATLIITAYQDPYK